ncbi:MAG: hypothetical protein JWR40_3901, partial [Massilia sp.]|nr:hypothetical protein [Massilia sp.]
MGRHDHQLVEPQLGEKVAKAQALFRVEAGGGLVDDQDVRAGRQRLGDSEPAPHAARKGRGRAPGALVQVDQFE